MNGRLLSETDSLSQLRLGTNDCENQNRTLVVVGELVEVIAEAEQIVIRKTKPKYQIDDLVAQMAPDNIESEVEFGPAIGNESW